MGIPEHWKFVRYEKNSKKWRKALHKHKSSIYSQVRKNQRKRGWWMPNSRLRLRMNIKYTILDREIRKSLIEHNLRGDTYHLIKYSRYGKYDITQ